MTSLHFENMQKYQNVAPKQVISAVEKAASKTGVDFDFLMEKASTESSFNPKAKAKGSSATGLFQFIEQTWLGMVKKHGEKYGLGDLADKIEMKDGKACVADCKTKNEILALRSNPEISALMAGEFSAENKDYLEDHTKTDVGSTELYLAHFMGAGGAAKFLNCRSVDGDATAACLFPAAAKANKNVFFDKKTGEARSLDEIYDMFAQKFTDGNDTPLSNGTASPSSPLMAADIRPARVPAADIATPSSLTLGDVAQALPSFDDDNEKDDIIWNDDPRFKSAFSGGKAPSSRLSHINMMVMTQMQETALHLKDKPQYNS